MIKTCYNCDLCGSDLPPTYVRTANPRPDSIQRMCQVDDVCPSCLDIWSRLDKVAVMRDAVTSGRTMASVTSKSALRGRSVNAKRETQDALLAYRGRHGLGCYAAVVEASGLTDEEVRNMASGNCNYRIEKWEKLRSGLSLLTAREASEGGGDA